MRPLAQCLKICLVKPLRCGICFHKSDSLCAGHRCHSRKSSPVAKHSIGGIGHSCKPNAVGLHDAGFTLGLGLRIVISNAGNVQVNIQSAKIFHQITE